MRLDYDILCIDDEIDSLRESKRKLSAYNESVGIKTVFIDIHVKQGARETNVDAFRERIENEIGVAFSENSFDLIMVDLHLGVFKGHQIINFIRDQQTMYRPIIFYSGGEPESDTNAVNQLQSAIQENGLVGKCIFLSSRGAALDHDLQGLCREMHEEEHKLNAGRGLLMDRTSEVDAKVLNYLRTAEAWNDLDEQQQAAFFKTITKELTRKAKKTKANSYKLTALAEGSFQDLKDWFISSEKNEIWHGLDSFMRNQILRELLRVQPEREELGNIHSDYFKTDGNISGIRNEYAHQTADDIGEAHNDERCKFIRSELRKHLQNISKVTRRS